MSEILYGSERKFIVRLKPIGDIRLADCTLKIAVYTNANNLVDIKSEHIFYEDEDAVRVILTTDTIAQLADAPIKFRIYLGIPDNDFPDAYRNQIYDAWEQSSKSKTKALVTITVTETIVGGNGGGGGGDADINKVEGEALITNANVISEVLLIKGSVENGTLKL